MNDAELEKINSLLNSAEKQISTARELLFGKQISLKAQNFENKGNDKVIEGVFDGESMICADGSCYPVPANYASKSKLITGDVLKLTILEDGTFVFKQIGPMPRKKLIGVVESEGDQYFVSVENTKYKVLLASVTFFKAKPGDKVTIIIPAEQATEYAAMENVIKGL